MKHTKVSHKAGLSPKSVASYESNRSRGSSGTRSPDEASIVDDIHSSASHRSNKSPGKHVTKAIRSLRKSSSKKHEAHIGERICLPAIKKLEHQGQAKRRAIKIHTSEYLLKLAIGCFFLSLTLAIGIGFMIFYQSSAKTIFVNEYTLCKKLNSNSTCHDEVNPKMSFDKPIDNSCTCKLSFELKEDISVKRVNIYYILSGYNQNYRFLAQSKDEIQLNGRENSFGSDKCNPNKDEQNRTIFPCGALANLMFDDEYRLTGPTEFNVDRYNIAFDGSRGNQYKNPSGDKLFKNYSSPLRWKKDIFSLDLKSPYNNGFMNGPFIVWMSISTFPHFSKLYAMLEPKSDTLREGTYNIEIDYNYSVGKYEEGKKWIRIESVGPFGVSNPRLMLISSGISFIYMGLFMFILFLRSRLGLV